MLLCPVTLSLLFWAMLLIPVSHPDQQFSAPEWPDLVCFAALVAAYYLTKRIVTRLERFWRRIGW
jgi:hypothetical protein